MQINADFVVMVRQSHHEQHCILSLRRELSRTLVEGSVERLSGLWKFKRQNYPRCSSVEICVPIKLVMLNEQQEYVKHCYPKRLIPLLGKKLDRMKSSGYKDITFDYDSFRKE